MCDDPSPAALRHPSGNSGGGKAHSSRHARFLLISAPVPCSWSACALVQTDQVIEIRAAANLDSAQRVLHSDVDWSDLERYGPPGFAVYVRIAFSPESGADVVNHPGEAPVDAMRASLAALASYATTSARGYAAIWDGWVSGESVPQAPRVKIPNREMLLFTGPVEALRDAPALAWYGSAANVLQEPHLVWPEDQAWCVACEVDEEIEFTVGCSDDASHALARALPGAVRPVRYGEPAPLYRNPV
jgi:hypothetical protein